MAESGAASGTVAAILEAVIAILGRGDLGASAKLAAVFEATLAQRIDAIARGVAPRLGATVLGGPFVGMAFDRAIAEGCLLPKLLGCYEAEIAPVVAGVGARGYDVIVNVGCAEGYYAVGLARLAPSARIVASDRNPRARAKCGEIARRNGVGDRVTVRDALAVEDWAAFAGQRVFVLCDIEGAEDALLDPVAAPALCGFDLLVEVHPDAGLVPEAFAARFASSHDADWYHPAARDPEAFPQLAGLSPLDRALVLVERLTPTPWVHLRRRGISP